MGKIVIAIDGYSGCGKSSTAIAVAKSLGYTYIDSGAMYRAVTLFSLKNKLHLDRPDLLNEELKSIHISFKNNPLSGNQETYLNGENVENEIRQMIVSQNVSRIAAVKEIRAKMVAEQQRLGKEKGVVMDGRDIGSVVFPDAELKIFMTANLETRALRRKEELSDKGDVVNLKDIKENLAERDDLDSSRVESPLLKMPDAIEIDTSNLEFDDQVEIVVGLAKQIIEKEDSYAGNN